MKTVTITPVSPEPQSMSRKLTGVLIRLVGLGLGAWIYMSFDISKSLKRLLDIDATVILVLLVCCLASISLRTLRWFLIIRKYSREPRFRSTLKYQFIGIFWGVLTPGRIGETAKTLYFSKYDGLDLARNLFIMFMDRFWELIGFVIVNMILFQTYILTQGSGTIPFAQLLLVQAAVLLVGFLAWVYRTMLLRLVGRALHLGRIHKIATKIEYLAADAHLFTILDACKYIGVSLAAWLAYYLTYIVIARALAIPLLDIQVVVAAAIAALAVMIPISIAGIGTRDAALVYIFSLFGATPVAAVSGSLVILGLNLLFVFVGMLTHQYEHANNGKDRHVVGQ